RRRSAETELSPLEPVHRHRGDLSPRAGESLPAVAGSQSQAGEGWSGRRGSNPRPTAWKAVTLPLSYSRLRSLTSPRTSARQARVPFTHFAPNFGEASPAFRS